MIPTVDELLAIDAWVGEAETAAEVDQRTAAAKEKLFSGRSAVEIAEIERVLDQAIAKQAAECANRVDPVAVQAAIAPVAERAAASGKVRASAPPYVKPTKRERWRNSELDGERAAMRAELAELLTEAPDPFFDRDHAVRVDREIASVGARLGFGRRKDAAR